MSIKQFAGVAGKAAKDATEDDQLQSSGEVILPNGVKAEYIVEDGVLELVILTDKGGVSMEVPPRFFDVSLLKKKTAATPEVA